MTYKELFPKVVERDREAIKQTIGKVLPYVTCVDSCLNRHPAFINPVIETTLEDAYQRGVRHGIDTVLEDPSAYDLFSREDGD